MPHEGNDLTNEFEDDQGNPSYPPQNYPPPEISV